MASSQPSQSTTRIEYQACGDYSGHVRRMEVREGENDARMDERSMTQSDATWLERRFVAVGPWERLDG